MCDKDKRVTFLKDEILQGKIIPDTVVDAVVWIQQSRLDIFVNTFAKAKDEPDETVLFFWNYEEKKPLMVRQAVLNQGHVIIDSWNTLLLQMEYLGYTSMRIAIAYRKEDKIVCGFVRNMAARGEDVLPSERLIGKLTAKSENAFVAYYTESGALSVRFRHQKKFDDEFYRLCLTGYQWEKDQLIIYVEAPLMKGNPQFTLRSLSAGEVCPKAGIELKDEWENGLRRVMKLALDFSDMDEADVDEYRLICSLDGHNFQIHMDAEVSKMDDMREIVTDSGRGLTFCITENKNGRFLLQVQTEIYPVMLSIVTAVYNTAPFLAEMIDSILKQDTKQLEKYLIGNETGDFKNKKYRGVYEFILVDDGSTDGSAEILDDYARLSDVIRVIHKENGGVSSARNAGIDVARGKYITFPDSDDKLTKNFVNDCLLYFEKHEKEIDFITIPLIFFDAAKGDHWTNYKFKGGNRIVDLVENPDAITTSTGSSVFKMEMIGDSRFDTSLINGEDIVFIQELLMRGVRKIGAISSCSYLYRRRGTGELSAVGDSKNNEKSYERWLTDVLERLLLESKNVYGRVPKYIQYVVMGQLQWRFSATDQGKVAKSVLGDDAYKRYKEKALSLLKYIDDDVILAQKKIWGEHFYYMFKHKYGKKADVVCEKDDVVFCFGNTRIPTLLGNCYIRLDFLTVEDGILRLEGYAMNFEPDIRLNIYVNNKQIEYTSVERDVNKYTMDDICFFATTFSAELKLDRSSDMYTIRFASVIDDIEIPKKQFRYSKTMPLAQSYKKSYYMKDGWAVRKEGEALVVWNLEAETSQVISFEQEFVEEIKKSKNAGTLKDILHLRQLALERLARKNSKKKIWLISDRVNEAGDNGEAMFRYLSEKKDSDVDAYFILSEKSLDFNRLKKFGKVIVRESKKHLMLQLMADYIVSSAGDEAVINPWAGKREETEVVRDLLSNPKYIFLQHGITKDDISGWVNRYNKNIVGFVCAAHREAQSILDYNYYYKKENVWLTGFPRHDRLYRNEKNYITIMPTWRKWLANGMGSNQPGKEFANSDYYKFYNELISDERLLNAAKKFGYKICFMPHPNVQSVLNLFTHHDEVEFFSSEKAYKDIYSESNLVITDYSSACMDFALLRKPVVYCQFDKEEFFENHTYTEGYYDYEKDGFGEVTYDMESLIDVVISYMKNGCQVLEPYGSRMDTFFAYHDQNNCERVYKKIKDLDK